MSNIGVGVPGVGVSGVAGYPPVSLGMGVRPTAAAFQQLPQTMPGVRNGVAMQQLPTQLAAQPRKRAAGFDDPTQEKRQKKDQYGRPLPDDEDGEDDGTQQQNTALAYAQQAQAYGHPNAAMYAQQQAQAFYAQQQHQQQLAYYQQAQAQQQQHQQLPVAQPTGAPQQSHKSSKHHHNNNKHHNKHKKKHNDEEVDEEDEDDDFDEEPPSDDDEEEKAERPNASWTIPQLKQYLRENDEPIPSGAKKADLLQAALDVDPEPSANEEDDEDEFDSEDYDD